MKTETLERLTEKQLNLNGLGPNYSIKNRVRKSSPAPTAEKPSSVGKATNSVPPEDKTDQTLVTKAAYTTWANDPVIFRTGGKQYKIPKGTCFLRIVEKCPFGQGYAEITFSEAVFRSFYPYQLLPSRLAVVIPHSHLYITPKKGQTWKGAKR